MSLQKNYQKYYYDLHIHTALSPCANDDMTPNDIVGMAILNGLDIIAVTDHNSIANAASVMKAAETANKKFDKNLVVLPGVEVTTAEEVHVLCLFDCIEQAQEFEVELNYFYSTLDNREDIFGEQILYDENDQIIDHMKRMLIAPSLVSFDHLHSITQKRSGVFIPAHIDRDSFSVTSNLGFLPPHLEINTIELFNTEQSHLYPNKKILYSSDAHQLWAINDRQNYLTLSELSAKAAIDFLRI